MPNIRSIRNQAKTFSAADTGILLGLLLVLIIAVPWILPASATDLPSRGAPVFQGGTGKTSVEAVDSALAVVVSGR